MLQPSISYTLKVAVLALLTTYCALSHAVEPAPDCSGDFSLNTQAQVDGFAAMCPTGMIGGTLYINGDDDITNLAGLTGVISIGGALQITTNTLPNFIGLDNLVSVGGNFYFDGMEARTSNAGLSSLETIGGNFDEDCNGGETVVMHWGGFESLKTVGTRFYIDGCDHIQTMTAPAFELMSSDSSFIIDSLDNLTSINGFDGVKAVGLFKITENPKLSRIDGFSSLKSVAGNFEVWDNPLLSDCSVLGPLLDANDDALPGPGIDPVPDVGGDIIDFDGSLDDKPNAAGCTSIAEVVSSYEAAEKKRLATLFLIINNKGSEEEE